MKTHGGLTEEEIVEKKLHHFISKFYRVKIFQGLIIAAAAALLIFFALIIIGNAAPDNKTLNAIAFYAGVLILAVVLSLFIFRPLLQRFGIIRGLNFKEASNIIRQKHKSIEDRIVNIIELAQERAGQENKLYDFAIAQKAQNISGFNFDEAISFRKLFNFLLRLAAVAAVCLGIFLIRPEFVKSGISHILTSNQQIAGLGNTTFVILNDSLEVESGKDFLLRFKVVSEFPVESVSIQIASNQESAGRWADGFEYLFKAVNSSVSFRLACNGVVSEEYTVKTLKKPEISNIQLKLIPPGYTTVESTIIEGDGNAEVPAGSTLIWTLKTVNTDELLFGEVTGIQKVKGNKNSWNYERQINSNLDYQLICKNENGLFTNYYYKISVVKDLYPSIDISDNRDSTISNDVYVQGVVQDDYGFSKLEVVENRAGKETVKEIIIKKTGIYEQFYYTLIPDSSDVFYFFRIWDNDRLNGPKSTDSRKLSIRTATKAELETINDQLSDSISNNLSDGMNAIDKMEKKISDFKMEQLVGELKPWEIDEKLKELNQLKQEVVDFLNNVSKANKEFTENEKLLKYDEELTAKAKQIQELMEGLLDDEMKELLKQFEDLAKEFNSRKAEDITEKMALNLEKLKEQMEMSLELFKKYGMEKDLLKQVDKLNAMADSLQNVNSQKEDSTGKFKDEFKKWEQEYNQKLQEDKELKKPMGLEELEKEREEIRQAADDLAKKESGKPSKESRSRASKSLKDLAKKLGDKLGLSGGEGESVDLEEIRQIRNSLNDFSVKQEELNKRIERINLVNPVFTSVIKEQKELQEKFVSVRDSLKSIGYKQPVITKIVGTELFHVETSLDNLFESYSASRADVVRIEQNKIMTEVNSMAVKLDELIRSMQNAKGSGKGDKGFTDSKKPKDGDQSGSEKLGKSKATQESLKEQLKSAIQKMKSGANGKKDREGLAKMLGEREMMRKALEQLTQGGGLGEEARKKANDALNMMKEVEKDIIYNRLSDQTMEKDNIIKTRLLEAENAEKERENENRRESKEFKGSFEPNIKDPGKVADQNKALEQMLKYNELKLKKFYQEKYQKYIESTKK